MTDLIELNRRRKRIRTWVGIALLPVAIVGLAFSAKFLSMYAFAHQSISSFVADDYAASEQAARGQGWANWFDSFRAPYNLGTALGGAENLSDARAAHEEALPLATGLDVCPVRINLSLVIERMGDAAQAEGDAARAAELYGEALEITVDTPEECDSEDAQDQSPDPSRDMSDQLDQQQDRQQQKQQQQQDSSPPDQGDGDEGGESEQQQEGPSDDELGEIEDRLGEGAEDRENQLGDRGESGGSGGTDKPW